MKSIIKRYYKGFLLRGIISMGFGPIILSIIFASLGLSGLVEKVSVLEMCLGIVSISMLAFISGALTMLYQIEEIPLVWSILAHGVVLYTAYTVVYIVNGWLKPGIIPFVVFTLIFVVSYIIIWATIYLITKKQTDKLSEIIKNKDE